MLEERGLTPNALTFTTLMAACKARGDAARALALLGEMESCGIEPDRIAYNAALASCIDGGRIADARVVLERMRAAAAHAKALALSRGRSEADAERAARERMPDMISYAIHTAPWGIFGGSSASL